MDFFPPFEVHSPDIGKTLHYTLLNTHTSAFVEINLENFEYFIGRLYKSGTEPFSASNVDYQLGLLAFKLYILEGLNIYMQLHYKNFQTKEDDHGGSYNYLVTKDLIRVPPRMLILYRALCEPMKFYGSILIPHIQKLGNYSDLLKSLHDVGLPFILRTLCYACNTEKLIPVQKEDLKIKPFICYYAKTSRIYRHGEIPTEFQTDFLKYVKHIRFSEIDNFDKEPTATEDSVHDLKNETFVLQNNGNRFNATEYYSIDVNLVNDIPVDPQHSLCDYLFQILLLPSEKPFFLMGTEEHFNEQFSRTVTGKRASKENKCEQTAASNCKGDNERNVKDSTNPRGKETNNVNGELKKNKTKKKNKGKKKQFS